MPVSVVPIIDISAPGAPAALDAAARDVGFFQVIGHGLDPQLPMRLLDAFGEFFALPANQRMLSAPPSLEINRGYSASESESFAYSLGVQAPPDLVAGYVVGPEPVDVADPSIAAQITGSFAPNIWPEAVPHLAPLALDYFGEVRRLAHRLTGLFARALGLDGDFFEAFTQHSTDALRCNWYERSQGSPEPTPAQQRLGAHTDYGIVTVLWADQVPGLQVLTKTNEWNDVVPEPGAFIVNIGDLLAQWTNDRWVSTLHRVVPPPTATTGPALRRSLAFFHDGDWDATIECLKTCCSAENPAKYEPVRALDHLMNKLLGGRVQRVAHTTAHIGDRADAL